MMIITTLQVPTGTDWLYRTILDSPSHFSSSSVACPYCIDVRLSQLNKGYLLTYLLTNGVLPCRWHDAMEHVRWFSSRLSGYRCMRCANFQISIHFYLTSVTSGCGEISGSYISFAAFCIGKTEYWRKRTGKGDNRRTKLTVDKPDNCQFWLTAAYKLTESWQFVHPSCILNLWTLFQLGSVLRFALESRDTVDSRHTCLLSIRLGARFNFHVSFLARTCPGPASICLVLPHCHWERLYLGLCAKL